MGYTEEQKKIIESEQKTKIINASAGTGKTFTMVETFYEYLKKEDYDASEFLVLTFTEKAAFEMKSRIYEKVMHSEKEHCYKINLDLAQISTFHSFCRRILIENYNHLDVEPNFKIIPQVIGEIFITEAVDEVIQMWQLDKNKIPELLRLLEIMSIDEVKNYIKKYYKQYKAYYEIKNIKNFCEIYNDVEVHLKKFDYYFKKAHDLLSEFISNMEEKNMQDKYHELFKTSKKIINCYNTQNYREMLINIYDWKKPDLRKGEFCKNVELKDIIKVFQGEIKEQVRYEIKNDFDIYGNVSLASILFDMTGYIEKIYKNKKKLLNGLDYTDLEHLVYELFKNNNTMAEKYNKIYKYIFIDEFQDTNYLQNEIVNIISRGNHLFLVGDVKQSIFRFREACPDIFREKIINQSILPLTNNFRSSKKIIDFINEVFEPDFIASKEICYDENNKLVYKRNTENIEKASDRVFINMANEEINMESQIYEMVKKIKEIINNSNFKIHKNDGGSNLINYSDIAILVKKNKYINHIRKIFLKENIPVASVSSEKYLDNIEIRDVFSIISVSDNPLQDIDFASALKSLYGNFTDKEILMIKNYSERNERLFHKFSGILNEIENNNKFSTDTKTKIIKFNMLLNSLRRKIKEMKLSEFVLYIINYDDFILKNLIFKNGKIRYQNLIKLYNISKEFEKNISDDIYLFKKYISRIKLENLEIDPAVDLNISENTIKIMTIHKSKGLEFPVVFLPFKEKDLTEKNNGQKGFIEYSTYKGMYFYHIDEQKRYKNKSFLYKLLEAENNRLDFEEELRLLYVSLTRAKDYIFIYSGTPPDETKTKLKSEIDFIMKNLRNDCNSYTVSFFEKVQTINKTVNKSESTGKDEYDNISYVKKTLKIPGREKVSLEMDFEYLLKKYSYQNLTEIKSKMIATEMASAVLNEDDVYYLSSFFREEKHDRIIKNKNQIIGIETHRIFQYLDFSKIDDENYIDYLIADLRKKRKILFIGEYEIKTYINNFKKTYLKDILKNINESDLFKEHNFSFGLSLPDLLKSDIPASVSKNILIQGKIDLIFRYKNEIYLIDYKTEKYEMIDENHLNKYNLQIAVYAEAVKSFYKVYPKKAILVFLKDGEFYEIDKFEPDKIFTKLIII